ncbi:MAG TPA: HAD-IA family hydrolase [Ktedonobacterales bacterium]|nr:HAD-IA family hydrolase [Ktedonobacterales bacterium]
MESEPATRHDQPAHTRAEYAVLWDVDGVIIDSAEQHRQAWAQLAQEEGLPYSNDKFWATFGMRNVDVIPRLFGVQGPPERIAALGERKETIYRALLEHEASALPGARELLAALHAAGYRQALGSSAPPANIEAIIRLLGIGDLLDGYVSGEMVTQGKPAPDIFLAGARLLGIEPAQCLVIEDAPAGVAAAHAGGMRCIGVRRAGQPDADGLASADYLATTLRDVDVALVDRLLGV